MTVATDSKIGKAVVIVLNWNAGEHLARCVESITRTVPPGTRVLLVDNASSDGSVERALAAAPSIELIRNDSNLGFAGAYNQAILQVPEPYVMLLNPDTIALRTGWLEDLLNTMDSDESIAAVACKLVFAHAPNLINSAGGMAYRFTGPVDIGFGQPDSAEFGPGLRPFAASGGAMLVRREVFNSLGGFDDAMFAYVEDVDLSWRIRLTGLQIAYAPKVAFRHVFSSTVGPLSSRKVFLTHRNWLRAMIKNYAPMTLIAALPAYAAWTVFKFSGALFVERSAKLAWQMPLAIAWNIRYLADTLQHRARIQRNRKVSDSIILDCMGPRFIEPLSSLLRRRNIAKR
jgi:GT2 family glycosyltransferase